jgi:hypothetical protein
MYCAKGKDAERASVPKSLPPHLSRDTTVPVKQPLTQMSASNLHRGERTLPSPRSGQLIAKCP